MKDRYTVEYRLETKQFIVMIVLTAVSSMVLLLIISALIGGSTTHDAASRPCGAILGETK